MKADTNKSKESNKEKFLKLVSDEKVDTVERNKERIKNRDMIRLSQSIALKVLNRLDVLNWSNKQFADEMGITLDEVKEIISGKTNLTLDVIAKLEKVLNISILQTKPFDQIISDLDTYKEVEEALEIIKNYNLWRRDNDNQYEMPNPKQLGIAIDVAIKVLEEKSRTK